MQVGTLSMSIFSKALMDNQYHVCPGQSMELYKWRLPLNIQIDNDGSNRLPSLINVETASSIPQTRDNGSNGGTTQNKYVNLFSCMDEKSDINIGFNNVIVPKVKQTQLIPPQFSALYSSS